MSRREARESEAKRHHSKLEREPSPKRPRRDGKPATERTSSNHNLDIGNLTDRDQRHRRRLQDALPLEAPLAADSKVGTEVTKTELDKKTSGLHDGTQHSSDQTEVPRSRSFFQHDERGSGGQGGRSFIRRATTEHGRRSDSKDRPGDRAVDMEQRDERSHTRVDDKNIWRHDGFFQMEAEAPPPARKRPAFREKKMPVDPENTSIDVTDSFRPSRLDRPLSGNGRREERGGRYPRDSDRLERPLTGERAPPRRGEEQRVGFPSRERFSGGSSFRGRERQIGRHEEQNQYSTTRVRVEKWKHDLFDEANRSPTPKNEEDQIAKVEALLAL